jgi:DNA (cytosine-5)-methyltransferase 1
VIDGLIIDSFAGGGGASLGIAWATGRSPDIAINHDASALAMHEANHPSTRHVCEDVWHANLRELTGGQPVGLLWASPDCKHFSRAKGSVPVSKHIRSLAWVVVRWASQVIPKMIMLENVREFADWGPLVPCWECHCGWKGTEGQAKLARTRRRCPRCDSLAIKAGDDWIPDPAKKGTAFRLFVNRLRGFGYKVEWRAINAADCGTPTHRRRLFLIARSDGAPIMWPEPTHGDPKKLDNAPLFDRLKPWRTAAECINWSQACPSIFDRKRPLADKTLRRIAMGLKRYVLEAAEPFIVSTNHGDSGGRRTYPLDEPMRTVTTHGRGGEALVTPYIQPVTHGSDARSHSANEPLPTITTAKRGEHSIIAPYLTAYHHQKQNESRCRPCDEPMNTLDTQPRYGLVSPSLIQTGFGERDGQAPRVLDINAPLGTVVAGGAKHALVSAFITKHFGGMVGVPVETPLPTTTERGTQNQLTAAHLIRMNHGEKQWNDVREPLVTVTSQGNKNGVVATHLIRFNHDDAGVPIDTPLPTQTTFGHCGLVYAFLTKYFGADHTIGQQLTEPLHTVTSKHRFGMVYVEVAPGQAEPAVAIEVPNVGPCVISDIGMRMLTPRELATAQGFPLTYELTGTKTSQVAKIGNSVCPQVVEAIVRANCMAEVAA